MLWGEALLKALATCDVQPLLNVVIASAETASRNQRSLADALVGASVVGAQQHGESIQALLLYGSEAEK